MSPSQSHNIREDKELARRLKNGEMMAYTQFIEKYQGPLTFHIEKLSRNRTYSEDLIQEVFVKAFENIHSYNEDYAFSTWIYRIATNHTIDFLRKKKIEAVSIDEPISSKDGQIEEREIPDTDYATDTPIIQLQRSQVLEEAINELPDKYREVIQLRHMEELSYEEISDQLSIPLGTVKAHLFRAREMLYKLLKEKKGSF